MTVTMGKPMTNADQVEQRILARNAERIKILQDSTSSLATENAALAAKIPAVWSQYLEGAITIEEFNLRLLEFTYQVNELARQFAELFMLEEIDRGERKVGA